MTTFLSGTRYTSKVGTRPVLRIFISSTAVDLRDCRDKVRDAVMRLEDLPIAMETFSAQSGLPAKECISMAEQAEAVICIVAHRYGYVPPPELGGDGERSITWLEVDAAKRAGKPVFAFLVDPKAPWTQVKEQDRIVSEAPEKAPEIVKAVQKLKEFKAYLEREHTKQTFTCPDELAKHVAIALANLAQRIGDVPTSIARVWHPLFCHALQPARFFRGREVMLLELRSWLQSSVTPDRVVSVVAAGGAGKTALIDQALRQTTISDRAGFFVWSFYEDTHTDAFLREAYFYFTGEKDAPAGGMLERLQIALSGDTPHVLILDGLERVQSEGGARRRGELEDLQLKRLLRALAGGVGNARALVTSRFPLVDLDDWTGAGHRSLALDDLECEVALDVLRAWNVQGDDDALTRLIEPLNVDNQYHALSVAVLGSYLGNFAGGDPNRVPEFSLEDARESDSKARRLCRILEQYAKALSDAERDLLARLSLFPRGVEIELLGWIVQSGEEVAGALNGFSDRQLEKCLDRLKALGLVFRYPTGQQVFYSAHPFLREFFCNLLGPKPESIHDCVRARLAPSLEARPRPSPKDSAILDQYELLMEQTLLAGRIQEAFDLYWSGLGGYRSFGWIMGENTRGLRILERFLPKDEFSLIDPHLPARQRSWLVNDLGLFAKNLGDLGRARWAFGHACELCHGESDCQNESIGARNLAEVELHAGHLPEALRYSEVALALALEPKYQNGIKDSLAYRAMTLFALGDVRAAAADFKRATEMQGVPLYAILGLWEAECKALTGDQSGARSQTEASREITIANNWNDDTCRCDALLAQLIFPASAAQACEYLQNARGFASSSGDVGLQLRCSRAACELHRNLGDYSQAIAEAEAGILLADTCAFGKYSIDLRLALSEAYLAGGDAHRALQHARTALDRSDKPDCQYAWGKADGLHFCGLAHIQLDEAELARQRLTAALDLRERLGHGGVEETRRALALCPP